MTAEVRLDEQALEEWVVAQRWFGSKAREVTSLGVLDMVPLRLEPRLLASVMVEARFAPGTHEVYQVPVAFRPVEEGWSKSVIAETGGLTIYDALADPEEGQALLELMRANARLESEHAVSEFHWVEGTRDPGPSAVVRPMGAEQSNSSLVFDEALTLKLYRRVEAGINPELELLRFLTERSFPHIAPLSGWYSYAGRPMDATLGIVQPAHRCRQQAQIAVDCSQTALGVAKRVATGEGGKLLVQRFSGLTATQQ
jgi:maltokinase